LDPLRRSERQADLAIGNLRLARVDADQRTAAALPHLLGSEAHGGDGAACQNPCLLRKSGKPESTPIPAQAVTNSASAALMAAAACLTLSSMLMEIKIGGPLMAAESFLNIFEFAVLYFARKKEKPVLPGIQSDTAATHENK